MSGLIDTTINTVRQISTELRPLFWTAWVFPRLSNGKPKSFRTGLEFDVNSHCLPRTLKSIMIELPLFSVFFRKP